MKRVLLITANGSEQNSGFGSRVTLMAESISQLGYDVTLIRFYPFIKTKAWKCAEKLEYKILQVPVLPTAKYSPLKFLSYIFGSSFLFFYTLIFKTDAIQAENPEASHLIKFLKWKHPPMITDFHGAIVEEAIYAGTRNKDTLSQHDIAEAHSIKSDMYFFVSEKLKKYIIEKYNLENKKTPNFVVPINTDTLFFSDFGQREIIRTDLGVNPQEILLVYSGGMQRYQCIEYMLDLFNRTSDISHNIKLLILTKDISILKELINKTGITNKILIRSAANKTEVSAYLSACDAAFLLREKEILNIVACPTKFGEYIASGLPIITTPWAGHSPALVTEYNLGTVIPMNNLIDDTKQLFEFTKKLPYTKSKIQSVANEVAHWDKCIGILKEAYSDLFNSET